MMHVRAAISCPRALGVTTAALLVALAGCSTTSDREEPDLTPATNDQRVLTGQVAAEQRERTRELAADVLSGVGSGALATFGASAPRPIGGWVGCVDDGKGYKYSASARFDLSTGTPADAAQAVASALADDGWRPRSESSSEDAAFTRDDHVATVFGGTDGTYVRVDVDGPCGVVDSDALGDIADGGSEDLPLSGVPTAPASPPST